MEPKKDCPVAIKASLTSSNGLIDCNVEVVPRPTAKDIPVVDLFLYQNPHMQVTAMSTINLVTVILAFAAVVGVTRCYPQSRLDNFVGKCFHEAV